MLECLSGVDVIADDVLCYGCGDTFEEAVRDHDADLRNLLDRARSKNLKFNISKLRLRLTEHAEVPYMGHLLSAQGLKPDPRKVQDLIDMQTPTDKKGIQRLLGITTYLSKFLPSLSEMCEPLRKVATADVESTWQSQKVNAFDAHKAAISTAPVLL